MGMEIKVDFEADSSADAASPATPPPPPFRPLCGAFGPNILGPDNYFRGWTKLQIEAPQGT